ncbi:MAG: low molecular weight phosphotyrosine protein phosphatase [Candidatus Ancillula sp.]|jgi:protein-tyrosine phosphatase|nr:low molecular weight phosphotyrosine protein phosphatase [Candidatus Ancillula sp.]
MMNIRKALTKILQLNAVCTGNICRSALAEVVLAAKARELEIQDQFEIISSGVSNEEQGNPMDRRAVQVLQENGYDLSDPRVSKHRAHQITQRELDETDVFLAMTSQHAQSLIKRFGVHPQKVFLWRWFERMDEADVVDGVHTGPDLIDPWYGDVDDFRVALGQIESSAEKVLKYDKF